MLTKMSPIDRIKHWGMKYRNAKENGWRQKARDWSLKISSALTILCDAEIMTQKEAYMLLLECYGIEKEETN